MKTLDCRGLNCPEPVLRTKSFLEEKAAGVAFEVLVDNEASRENVKRFGRSQGCEVRVTEVEFGCFLLLLQPGENTLSKEEFRSEVYGCELSSSRNLVYVISADSMGRGSDELGWALLQTYVTTISEISPLPSHVILYNGGVKLAAVESKGLEALQKLEQRGVTVWACGTCLEFFKLEEDRKVGTIANMFDIMSTMANAEKVISPL